MPSVSPKQARFMAAVAHNPEFARKAGVSQSVGKEFNDADRMIGKAMSLADIASGKPKISGALAGVIHRAKMARG